jgi:hypothetical protein
MEQYDKNFKLRDIFGHENANVVTAIPKALPLVAMDKKRLF